MPLVLEMRFVSYYAGQRRRPIGLSDTGGTVLSVQQFRSVRTLILALLCLFTTLFSTPKTSFCAEPILQSLKATKATSALPVTVVSKWRITKVIRILKGKECEALPDGEIGLEYGLNSVAISNYTNGKDEYVVESFAMRFPSGAYGFFTFLQSRRDKGQRLFWAGHQLIRVRRENSSTSISSDFFEGLKKAFEGHNSIPPPLTTHLPKKNRIAGEEVYLIGSKALASHPRFGLLKDGVNFEGGTEAVSAEYHQSEKSLGLLLLEFHTPQLATDGYAKLDALKSTLSEPSFSQTVIKRVGNYVVVATPVKDAKTAESTLGEIKYTAVVHWEGKTYSAIPLEYRPPDTAALEEASETALVLLRTFYWIGSMLALAAIFGVCTGSGFFYWRRYQRKKAGSDDLFSDAGGTIRLNLDGKSEKFRKVKKEATELNL